MARGFFRGGRAVLVVVLAGVAVACGQLANLKAQRHFKEANGFYSQADYRRAAAEYEEALKANPNETRIFFYLANSYDNMFKPARKGEAENDSFLEKAVRNYEIAAEKDADPKQKKLALQYLAAAYGADKLNDPAKAEPIVKKIIDMDPSDTDNYLGLAKLYDDAGRTEEAERVMLQARDAKPNSPEVYLSIADFYNRNDQFEKAVAAHEERAKLDPNNPEAFFTLAAFYETAARKDYRLSVPQKKDYIERGLVAVDKALGITPDYIEAITYKNLLLRQQALVEKDPAKQKALIAEAEKLHARALELQKLKTKGIGA